MSRVFAEGFTHYRESSDRVGDGTPEFRSRWRWRAERRARRMNAMRDAMGFFPTYRYGVVHEDGRWCVVAFQNYASPA